MLSVHSPWPACSLFTVSISSNTLTSSPTPKVFTLQKQRQTIINKFVKIQFSRKYTKDKNNVRSSASQYLCQCPRMESPADIVAVLDSDVSSVSDSMNCPDPANVLQTQIGCFTLGLLSAWL